MLYYAAGEVSLADRHTRVLSPQSLIRSCNELCLLPTLSLTPERWYNIGHTHNCIMLIFLKSGMRVRRILRRLDNIFALTKCPLLMFWTRLRIQNYSPKKLLISQNILNLSNKEACLLQVIYDVRSFTVTELSLLRKKHDPEGACRSTVLSFIHLNHSRDRRRMSSVQSARQVPSNFGAVHVRGTLF